MNGNSVTRPPVPLYVALARAVTAYENCLESGNVEWKDKHLDRIEALCKRHLPHGSGLDGTVMLDTVDSKPDRLVIYAEFHHMNGDGYYDGWTYHDVIVKPSLAFGLDLRITGPNRNDIKDYLGETFDAALRAEVDEYPEET